MMLIGYLQILQVQMMPKFEYLTGEVKPYPCLVWIWGRVPPSRPPQIVPAKQMLLDDCCMYTIM